MKKIIIFIVAVALILVCVPVFAEETESISITVAAGETYEFSDEDFASIVSDDLRGIIIVSLPETGILEYGNREILKGEGVITSGLSGLRYTAEETGEASFIVQPVYWSGDDADEVTVSITSTAELNSAPVAEDVEIKTYKNVSVGGIFNAYDEDGDELTYRIVSMSARGSVESDGEFFVYSPYEGKTGKDSFTYVAVDSEGNVSNEATVSVKIEKASTKVTYSDMEGSAEYYAAVRLAEEEIYTGSLVDGEYVFGGDEILTRGEFVVLAVCAAGLDGTEVTVTGFMDDEEISDWLKPYVATAVITGAIKGISTEAGVYFAASDELTGAQAAVITAVLMGLDTSIVETFADDSVPTWAAASVSALNSESVWPSSLSASDTITRAEAAVLLCAILDAT